MAVIGGIPVLPAVTPHTASGAVTDTRTLALRSLDGTDLMPFGGAEFFLQDGIQGMGMAPRDLVTEQIPGMAGSMLRQVTINQREVFLPLYMAPSSGHLAFLADMQALEDLLTPLGTNYDDFDGDLDIVANSGSGSTQVQRTLRVTYSGGMEDGYGGGNSGPTWAALGMKFLAVQPYWVGPRWSTKPFTEPGPVAFFTNFPPQFSESRALGSGVPFTVTGRRPSWVQIDIDGPASSVTINGAGITMSLPRGVALGEHATIVTDPRRRSVSFNGVEDWSRVGPATTWQPLNPGNQQIDLLLTNPSRASTIVLSGDSLWERPW